MFTWISDEESYFQFFYKNGNEYDHVDIIGKSKNINVVISTSKLSQKKTRTIVIYTKKLMYSFNLINNSVEIISHEGLESLNTKVVGGFKEKLNTTFPIIDHSEPLVEQMKHFLFTIEKNELEENYEEFSEELIDEKAELKFSDLELIFKDLKSLFEKKGFIINWKALEKQNLDETINALSMASPFTLEEKQILLEAQNLDLRKNKIAEILKTYSFDLYENNTVQ